MTFWFELYLWIGFACLTVTLLLRARQIWEVNIAPAKTGQGKLIATGILLLGLLLATIVWPVTASVLIWALIEPRFHKPFEPPTRPVFAPTLADLGTAMTVDEIEAVELITDPFDAVPQLPFGHLNEAWLAFRQKLHPDTTLRHFSSHWTHDWNGTVKYEGYAEVRNGKIMSFVTTFVTRDLA